jgi:hypothetical protein
VCLKLLSFFLQVNLFASGFLFFLAAAQPGPTHSISSFHNPPSKFFFFDDTQVSANMSEIYSQVVFTP